MEQKYTKTCNKEDNYKLFVLDTDRSEIY